MSLRHLVKGIKLKGTDIFKIISFYEEGTFCLCIGKKTQEFESDSSRSKRNGNRSVDVMLGS